MAPTEPEKDTEDEEDDEEIVRPKGRMAARMQAAKESSEEDVEPSGDNARERVKKLFMSKNKAPEPSANNEDAEGSDESDVPVVSRKRKIRTRRETPKSSPAKDAGSPGLFVSPSGPKPASPGGNASDSDDLPDVDRLPSDARFKALVARKRQEREAREKEAAEEKAKKLAERKRHTQLLEEDENELSDEEGRRRLTQPTRKAGKKAQEEIRRETQRMSRNQQLAHNATTKKKFSKQGFFARMGYRQDVKVEGEATRPTSSSSAAPPSDAEMKSTPPTSPASPAAKIEKTVETSLPSNVLEAKEDDDELPSLEDALSRLPSSPPTKLDKGKGRAIEEPTPEPETRYKPIVGIRQPKQAGKQSVMADDSDSDIEIVSVKTPNAKNKKLDSIFNNLPAKQAKESRSLHALRMLAHLTSPGKKNFGKDKKPGMTTTELQMSLQQRARQQATREREERLQALREKGVIIQTAEEREKENAEVEDLMERARREGEEIQKREKAAAKKERKDKGEADPLGDDSSDDEDWVEEKQKPEEDLSVSGSEDEEVEASGSGEDEEDDEMEVDGQDEENAAPNPLFDNEASDTDDDEAEAEVSVDEEMAGDGDIDEDDELELPVKQKQRRSRKTNIISDDEDEDGEGDKTTPVAPKTDSPVQQKDSPGAPNSVLRSATKTFIPGVTVSGPVGLGLTQIFAGTMDESQAMSSTEPNEESQQMDTQEDSMAFLKRLPTPELPDFVPTMEEDTQTQDQDMIMDSQPHVPESQSMESQTQKIRLDFSQSQMHGFDSIVESTQMSPFPATQDIGFQHMTPIRGRFVDAPPSTVETVILEPTAMPETTEETPIVKKKGKLRRRAPAVAFSDEEDDAEPEEKLVEDDEFEITADAFDVMRKAQKKKAVVVDEFDKKTSKAKEMIHEQAEESEDEYAGLGGASDDESGGEEDALVKAMMDDEGGEKVDERKLAAFFA
jgi:mediator of replication checkpoint protein 1